MITVLLKILSILGILLLILLGILLIVALLVLFFPITYRFFGRKYLADDPRGTEGIVAWFSAKWLFGILRVDFQYPSPGNVTIKLLWYTLYDSTSSSQNASEKSAEKENGNHHQFPEKTPSTNELKVKGETSTTGAGEEPKLKTDDESAPSPEKTGSSKTVVMPEQIADVQEKTFAEHIAAKIEKIKYTFQKIYDKIKHIWENISYYKELLQDEDTHILFQHVKKRIGNILRFLRPHRLKADILFGTGAPDTTGYLYGVYGMVSPKLGPKVVVTPDFTKAVLSGEVFIAGHIIVFQLLCDVLILFLDKRLHLFIHRLKAGRK